MSARNHVEAMQQRAKRRRTPKRSYTAQLALAGSNAAIAARILLRRLGGAIDTGDVTLSGSEDMCEAVRSALVSLEQATRTFETIARGPEV